MAELMEIPSLRGLILIVLCAFNCNTYRVTHCPLGNYSDYIIGLITELLSLRGVH